MAPGEPRGSPEEPRSNPRHDTMVLHLAALFSQVSVAGFQDSRSRSSPGATASKERAPGVPRKTRSSPRRAQAHPQV